MNAKEFARFSAKYKVRDDGCWEWTAVRDKGGYGRLEVRWPAAKRGFRPVQAHRLSYIHFVGPVEDGLVVRHKCDRPWCVNPSHLEVGTNADNSRDAVERGRTANGSRNTQSKIDEAAAGEICAAYAQGESQVSIARRFGVSRSNVGQIVRGERWAHVAAERECRWRWGGISRATVEKMRRDRADGLSFAKISARHGVSASHARRLVSGDYAPAHHARISS